MRDWLYSRLSRDDDEEQNSLENQRKIIREYAVRNGDEIVGESADDNMTGMNFDRPGIEEITEAAEAGAFDCLVVKDMSRLGRNNTQTLLYIDFLRSKNIRVISVTEGIDSFDENDDLIIGVKGIFNDMYVKDISRKVRTGYYQKQKEGIITTPPFGYFKDKNTGEVVVVEETAAIVRQIFDWYIEGYGFNAIAKKLNDAGIKSPNYYMQMLFHKRMRPDRPAIAHEFLWNGTGVKRILENEFYIGTLICHKTYNNKIRKIRKNNPEEEYIRHENAVPAIIPRDKWERVQTLIRERLVQHVRAGPGRPCHRYAGLLQCADCGSTFVARRRKWRDWPDRIEYSCNGYHRYGKEHCTAHRINETELDVLIYSELMRIKQQAQANWAAVEDEVKAWMKAKSTTEKQIGELEKQKNARTEDLQGILMERIRDKAHEELYNAMIEKCEADIADIERRIAGLKDIGETVRRRKAELKANIDLLDCIVRDEAISDANLRLLVEKIIIHEEGKHLQIEVNFKSAFSSHMNVVNFDTGNSMDLDLTGVPMQPIVSAIRLPDAQHSA